MADEMKDYMAALAAANEADAAFETMVNYLADYVSKIRETPSAAEFPPAKWPISSQISQTYLKMKATRKTAETKFNLLPADQRAITSSPSKIGRR